MSLLLATGAAPPPNPTDEDAVYTPMRSWAVALVLLSPVQYAEEELPVAATVTIVDEADYQAPPVTPEKFRVQNFWTDDERPPVLDEEPGWRALRWPDATPVPGALQSDEVPYFAAEDDPQSSAPQWQAWQVGPLPTDEEFPPPPPPPLAEEEYWYRAAFAAIDFSVRVNPSRFVEQDDMMTVPPPPPVGVLTRTLTGVGL